MKADTIGVIPEAETLDEAYSMGYSRFADADPVADGDEAAEHIEHFTESAEYANSVAPNLRALSGYVDSGPGTYTVERQIVVVPDGAEADLPRDGKHMALGYVFEIVHDAWRAGVYDAVLGNEYGETDDTSLT